MHISWKSHKKESERNEPHLTNLVITQPSNWTHDYYSHSHPRHSSQLKSYLRHCSTEKEDRSSGPIRPYSTWSGSSTRGALTNEARGNRGSSRTPHCSEHKVMNEWVNWFKIAQDYSWNSQTPKSNISRRLKHNSELSPMKTKGQLIMMTYLSPAVAFALGGSL